MPRNIFALTFSVLLATVAFAHQSQTPPPATPSPTPTGAVRAVNPVTGTMTAERGGMVVVERQASGAGGRGAGSPTERIALSTFIMPAGPTSWQNVKVDVGISDAITVDTQHNKTVSLLCLDGNSGQVRSHSGEALINIDARPAIRPDGRIYLQLILEYRRDLTGGTAPEPGAPRMTSGFSESLNLLVLDGKPIVASQSADPRSDRKVTVEVTATVLK